MGNHLDRFHIEWSFMRSTKSLVPGLRRGDELEIEGIYPSGGVKRPSAAVQPPSTNNRDPVV